MNQGVDKQILKGVSRSFYVSLRLLPAPMRAAASLGYLLARTSDTLADHSGIPLGFRLDALNQFQLGVEGSGAWEDWPGEVVAGVMHSNERQLLLKTGDLIAALRCLPEAEAVLVRKVVAIIIEGQRLDLERFGNADRHRPMVLENEVALDDYTWRVAGCVGEFWTSLGALTMGERFASVPLEDLIADGIAYGKGLQLVNILRDLPKDLADGRCYLPVRDATDRWELMQQHQKQVALAKGYIRRGLKYIDGIQGRRLKIASGLPALLAEETLELLTNVSWEALERGVKIKRRRVYAAILRLCFQ